MRMVYKSTLEYTQFIEKVKLFFTDSFYSLLNFNFNVMVPAHSISLRLEMHEDVCYNQVPISVDERHTCHGRADTHDAAIS